MNSRLKNQITVQCGIGEMWVSIRKKMGIDSNTQGPYLAP